jgi:hypothetical protein
MQLVELEDLEATPTVVRDGARELLDFFFDRIGFYREVLPRLAELLRDTGRAQVLDLCSGAGGGALTARRELLLRGVDVELTLTDLHPSEPARERVAALADPRTAYAAHPVDALSGGGDVAGVRTMWGALHHFPPEAVSTLLAGMVARGEPLAFFDVAAAPALRRTPVVFMPPLVLLNAALLFALSLVLCLAVRPLRASRLALTYLVPAIPFLYAWDGTVSALRAYSPDELLALARAVPGAERYRWEAGRGGQALYLVGVPLAPVAPPAN